MTLPRVSLVGAGPGDPGLITVRGLQCLRNADVVVYDEGVPRRLLEHARAGAELIAIGPPTTAEHAQEAISYLLADKAREGKRVARLKRGDPFVFDRGGEEALYLHEQGIAFEIVPGIPAALGVPVYAGVPATYAGGGNTFTIVGAFDDDARGLPAADWATLARLGGTVVCHASALQVPRVLEDMAAHGWTDAQVMLVVQGTLPTQQTLTGTPAELLEHVRASQRRDAATIVAGRVIGFREHLRWFDTRPLFGRRILVTRPRAQAAELVDPLHTLGADTIEAPMIRIVPPEDLGPLVRAAREPDAFDWIVFTSANAVDAFIGALLTGSRDVRALSGPRLCAVGPGTAQALTRYGLTADLVPAEHRAEAVLAALADRVTLDGARVLLPRADIGREVIAEGLRGAGSVVTDVVAYRTVPEDTQEHGYPDVYGMLLEGQIDVVTFTSASAVRQFSRLYGAEQVSDLLGRTAVAVIGPVTAEAAAQLGIPVAIQPATYTIAALVDAIAAHFTTPPSIPAAQTAGPP